MGSRILLHLGNPVSQLVGGILNAHAEIVLARHRSGSLLLVVLVAVAVQTGQGSFLQQKAHLLRSLLSADTKGHTPYC